MNDAFVSRAAVYYTGKLRQHGPTHRGADWNSVQSQELRFAQLLRVCEGEPRVAVNDYGCGYGALVDYLVAVGRPFEYGGYDASAEMVEAARARHAGTPGCEFSSTRADLAPRAYTIASGIFNVKFETSRDAWWSYVSGVLDDIAAASVKGFAFNLLTSYSDPDRRRDDLFYAEPEAVFGHCMKRFSRGVALSHDYPLYEFTVLVRL
jgi:SAM-dependent methyltransferase